MMRRRIMAIGLAGLMAFGCTRMYVLPDAPPESEWVVVAAPKEDPEVAMRRYLDAKRGAIQCYAALASEDWGGALSWMTQETVAALEAASGGEGARAALESGVLLIEGIEVPFDPVEDVFIRNLNDIRDETEGIVDDETESRKVLYAVSGSGESRAVILLLEDGRWRVHWPSLQPANLTE